MAQVRPVSFSFGGALGTYGELLRYGVKVGGVPAGDAGYVDGMLACKA